MAVETPISSLVIFGAHHSRSSSLPPRVSAPEFSFCDLRLPGCYQLATGATLLQPTVRPWHSNSSNKSKEFKSTGLSARPPRPPILRLRKLWGSFTPSNLKLPLNSKLCNLGGKFSMPRVNASPKLNASKVLGNWTLAKDWFKSLAESQALELRRQWENDPSIEMVTSQRAGPCLDGMDFYINGHWKQMEHTWWFIPLSKWVITPVIRGLTPLIPFITRVVTHLLSGMNHQVGNIWRFHNWWHPKWMVCIGSFHGKSY